MLFHSFILLDCLQTSGSANSLSPEMSSGHIAFILRYCFNAKVLGSLAIVLLNYENLSTN